jgi:phospholipid-translocating ATPase
LVDASYGETECKGVSLKDDFKKCEFIFEAPNKNLYNFKGSVEHDLNPELNFNMNNKSLLLRGSSLANTNWIIGMPLYTGAETKLMKNQG